MRQHLKNFLSRRSLLLEFVKKDYKLKYKNSNLGILWSLLNPIIMVTILSLVFSTLFARHTPNYLIYLLTGKIMYDYLSESTSTAMSSILTNSSLIKKVYIPKYFFPLSKVLLTLINLLITTSILLVLCLITNVGLHSSLLLLPVLYIMFFGFVAGLGLILSVFYVFFRDTSHIYSVFLLAWMYATPIIYPIEIVPEKYRILFEFNPLYFYISYNREIVINGTIPSLGLHAVCFCLSTVTLGIGLYLFKKNQDNFILYI